jgi:hypothetical protein
MCYLLLHSQGDTRSKQTTTNYFERHEQIIVTWVVPFPFIDQGRCDPKTFWQLMMESWNALQGLSPLPFVSSGPVRLPSKTHRSRQRSSPPPIDCPSSPSSKALACQFCHLGLSVYMFSLFMVLHQGVYLLGYVALCCRTSSWRPREDECTVCFGWMGAASFVTTPSIFPIIRYRGSIRKKEARTLLK